MCVRVCMYECVYEREREKGHTCKDIRPKSPPEDHQILALSTWDTIGIWVQGVHFFLSVGLECQFDGLRDTKKSKHASEHVFEGIARCKEAVSCLA